MTTTPHNRAGLAIGLILLGVAAISVNDMLIKRLSGGYPLHQIVFTRSAIGIVLGLLLVKLEGGFHLLKTRQPGLHLLRLASDDHRQHTPTHGFYFWQFRQGTIQIQDIE